jgi:hypothetical protein
MNCICLATCYPATDVPLLLTWKLFVVTGMSSLIFVSVEIGANEPFPSNGYICYNMYISPCASEVQNCYQVKLRERIILSTFAGLEFRSLWCILYRWMRIAMRFPLLYQPVITDSLCFMDINLWLVYDPNKLMYTQWKLSFAHDARWRLLRKGGTAKFLPQFW